MTFPLVVERRLDVPQEPPTFSKSETNRRKLQRERDGAEGERIDGLASALDGLLPEIRQFVTCDGR